MNNVLRIFCLILLGAAYSISGMITVPLTKELAPEKMIEVIFDSYIDEQGQPHSITLQVPEKYLDQSPTLKQMRLELGNSVRLELEKPIRKLFVDYIYPCLKAEYLVVNQHFKKDAEEVWDTLKLTEKSKDELVALIQGLNYCDLKHTKIHALKVLAAKMSDTDHMPFALPTLNQELVQYMQKNTIMVTGSSKKWRIPAQQMQHSSLLRHQKEQFPDLDTPFFLSELNEQQCAAIVPYFQWADDIAQDKKTEVALVTDLARLSQERLIDLIHAANYLDVSVLLHNAVNVLGKKLAEQAVNCVQQGHYQQLLDQQGNQKLNGDIQRMLAQQILSPAARAHWLLQDQMKNHDMSYTVKHSSPNIFNGEIKVITTTPDGTKTLQHRVLDNAITVRNAISGECLQELKGHTDYVTSLALTADGKRLVSGSYDKTIRLWDILTGKCLAILSDHARINIVRFAPGDSCIISGSNDGNVKIWDIASKTCIKTLSYPERATVQMPGAAAVRINLSNIQVRNITISPDGKQITATYWNTEVTWNLADATTQKQLDTLQPGQAALLQYAYECTQKEQPFTSASMSKSNEILQSLPDNLKKIIQPQTWFSRIKNTWHQLSLPTKRAIAATAAVAATYAGYALWSWLKS